MLTNLSQFMCSKFEIRTNKRKTQRQRQKDEDNKTNPFQKTKSRYEKIVERTKRRILKSNLEPPN